MQIIGVEQFDEQNATLYGNLSKPVTDLRISKKGDTGRFTTWVTYNGQIAEVFVDGTFTGEVLQPYADTRMQVLGSNGNLVEVPKDKLPQTAVFIIRDDFQYPQLTGKTIFV